LHVHLPWLRREIGSVESKNASIIVTKPLVAGEHPAAPVPTSLALLREPRVPVAPAKAPPRIPQQQRAVSFPVAAMGACTM